MSVGSHPARSEWIAQRAGVIAFGVVVLVSCMPTDASLPGIPLRDHADLAGLVVLVSLAPHVRRHLTLATGALCAVGLLLFATAKIVAPDVGAPACFHANQLTDRRSACEFSFDAPAGDVTRRDTVIDAGSPTPISSIAETNWALAFANGLTYNDYRPVDPRQPAEDPRRPRFRVTWTDVGAIPAGSTVAFTGKLVMKDGGSTIVSASALEPRVVKLAQALHNPSITLIYDRVAVKGSPPASYAYIRLLGHDEHHLPVGPRRSMGDTLAGVIGLCVALAAIVDWGRLRELWLGRWTSFVISACIIGTVLLGTWIAVGAQSAAPWHGAVPPPVWLPIVPIGLVVALSGRQLRGTALRLSTLVLLWPIVARMRDFVPHGRVAYRHPGDDPLAYAAYARVIVTERSLHGGEDTFRFQPGGRYVQALGKLLIGEEDRLFAGLVVWIGLAGVVWLAARLARRGTSALSFAGLGCAVLLLAQGYGNVGGGLVDGMAWSTLPFIIGLLLLPTRNVDVWWGLFLVGFTLAVRVNQAPGALLACALLAWSNRPASWKRIVAYPSAVAWFVIPTVVHNLHYGHGLSIVHVDESGVAIPFSRLVHIFDDAGVRRAARAQMMDLVYLSSRVRLDAGWALAFYSSILVIFVGIGFGVARCRTHTTTDEHRRRTLVATLSIPVVIVLLLGIYVSFKAVIYYPRHLVWGYEAAVLLVAVLGSVTSSGPDLVELGTPPKRLATCSIHPDVRS